MGNLNKVFLIGRLGGEPEPKQTKTGKSVLNVTLASSEFYKDKDGNKQNRTEWHRVVLWERLAEIVSQYCHKGSQLFVEGSLQTREWEDKNGNKRYTTEILGRNIQLLDPKGQGQSSGYQVGTSKQSNYPGYDNSAVPQAEQQTKPFEVKKNDEEFVEEDIPF